MYAAPDLKIGSRGAEVGNLQRFLCLAGFTDWNDQTVAADEIFGLRTSAALRKWQEGNGLYDSGVFRLHDRDLAQSQGFIPFVQSLNYTRVYPAFRQIDVIVIHTMESSEKPGMAENVALWFAGKTKYTAPRASAHFCIDSIATIQCVRQMDVAWHCPGINHNGIGIEHAGRASQTKDQWNDDESKAILRKSAKLVAKLCKEHNLPIIKLSPDELKAKRRGLCGHNDGSIAFPGPGRNHWDPGIFVWEKYLEMVHTYSEE